MFWNTAHHPAACNVPCAYPWVTVVFTSLPGTAVLSASSFKCVVTVNWSHGGKQEGYIQNDCEGTVCIQVSQCRPEEQSQQNVPITKKPGDLSSTIRGSIAHMTTHKLEGWGDTATPSERLEGSEQE